MPHEKLLQVAGDADAHRRGAPVPLEGCARGSSMLTVKATEPDGSATMWPPMTRSLPVPPPVEALLDGDHQRTTEVVIDAEDANGGPPSRGPQRPWLVGEVALR